MTSFHDWIVETSSTLGTSDYELGGAPAGTSYFPFRHRWPDGDDEVFYWVRNADRTKWEKHQLETLTYGSPGADTLSRAGLVESTNGDGPVSWVSGDLPLTIYCAPDSDVSDGAIHSWLAQDKDDIPALLFGPWWKADDIATPEAIEHRLRDDGVVDDGILLGAFNKTARKYIPDAAAINFPPGYIEGLTYGNSSGDATNDIDFFAGSCEDKTGVYPLILAATLTKRLDAAWAVGTNQGGLDTGSIANTDYFLHVIGRSDTGVVDGLFSASLASPTLPANYDYSRPIGWIRRSGGAILPFTTYEMAGGGLDYHWATAIVDMSTVTFASASTNNLRTMSVPVGLAVTWKALVSGLSGNAWGFLIKTPGVTGNNSAWFLQGTASGPASGQAAFLTDTSARVAFDVSTTVGGVGVQGAVTYGWTWSRR